jgi:hypothetical protein
MKIGGRDWHEWHAQYDEDPVLRRRLATVQRRIRDALDAQPAGPIRVVAACAGEGRDLLGALDGHRRATDVRARLVELDDRLVQRARENINAARLSGVEVRCSDAGRTSSYAGAVPADVVLMCGVFGNVLDDDVERIVSVLPSFCAPSATVIWTRHRKPPDLTPAIRAWFTRASFTEVAFDAPDDVVYSVGTNRYDGPPVSFDPDVHLFAFVDQSDSSATR